jgi:hypothetical protein
VDRLAVAGLLASLVVVAVVTLTPEGTGWAWADPVQEIRWYLTGLTSPATLLQWVGNLALLAVPAAFAALRWPALTAPGAAWAVALTAAGSIEVTQWLLPLGRVVSPVDAVLNATGAVVAVWLVRRARARTATRPVSCR